MNYYKFLIKSKLNAESDLKSRLHRAGFSFIKNTQKYQIYCMLGSLTPNEEDDIRNFLFCDKEETCEMKKSPEKASKKNPDYFQFEVMLKPGVTDTASSEIMSKIKTKGFKNIKEITSGTGYIMEGTCSNNEKKKVAEFLCNNVIQYWNEDFAIPKFVSLQSEEQIAQGAIVEEFDIANMNDTELLKFSEEKSSALDLKEMQKIREYYKTQNRKCTDAEFETIAQTWSEHCVHKTFKANIKIDSDDSTVKKNYPGLEVNNVLKSYIKKATDEINTEWIVSAFVDNAGIVRLNEDYDISFKVETHNHPSAIEPFGGANTGVGGVIRDIMGVSARPFAITDVFCAGNPDLPYNKTPAGSIHPSEIVREIINGIKDYGSKMEVPTVNGGIHFADGYTTNPLVYCGCAGISPRDIHKTEPQIGDHIFTIGAKTGRDAIRGATFSSMIVNASTGTVAGSAVQIGAPTVQRKVSEALVDLSKQELYSAITDCGAGGFSSAVGEMASELGCYVDLTGVPEKYPGLRAWEVWVSESQERMVLAVPEKNIPKFEKICKFYNVEFFDLGKFTGNGVLKVKRNGKTVINLDCNFLHSGPPQRLLTAKPYHIEKKYPVCKYTNIKTILLDLLSDLNVCSREHVVRLFDQEVQGGTILRPYEGVNFEGPSDAAVIQPQEIKGKVAVALSNALNFRASEFGAYKMTQATIDEAVRSVIAVGADPERIGILDNYCMGDPKRTEVMWDLVESTRACYDTAKLFKTPFISGKDSFNNEYLTSDGERVAIPTSLLISAMAVVPNIDVVPGSYLKKAGNHLYLLGKSDFQFGASIFAEKFGVPKNTNVRFTNFYDENAEIYTKLYKAISEGLISSCHDISDGGLLVAVAEMCIGGKLGAELCCDELLEAVSLPELQALFGETCGCFVIEINPKKAETLSKVFGENLVNLGNVSKKPCLQIQTQESETSISLTEIKKAFTTKRF